MQSTSCGTSRQRFEPAQSTTQDTASALQRRFASMHRSAQPTRGMGPPSGWPASDARSPTLQSVLQGLMSHCLQATHKQQHKCMQAEGTTASAQLCQPPSTRGPSTSDWWQHVGDRTTPSLAVTVSCPAFMHCSAAEKEKLHSTAAAAGVQGSRQQNHIVDVMDAGRQAGGRRAQQSTQNMKPCHATGRSGHTHTYTWTHKPAAAEP